MDRKNANSTNDNSGVFIFAEITVRQNIAISGGAGISWSATYGVIAHVNPDTRVREYGTYAKISLGASIGVSGSRIAVGTGFGRGDLDSFRGNSGNLGLMGVGKLDGEASLPFDFLDDNGDPLFDLNGIFTFNKYPGTDKGIGGRHGYFDIGFTDYNIRSHYITDIIDHIERTSKRFLSTNEDVSGDLRNAARKVDGMLNTYLSHYVR